MNFSSNPNPNPNPATRKKDFLEIQNTFKKVGQNITSGDNNNSNEVSKERTRVNGQLQQISTAIAKINTELKRR